ncbi:MAG: exodeoxyribonuclease VII large subunit [Betaproteobacteria bacterium]|nr:exodeoxyribonuclease VII large subunit [Betaproteobacteria bacterium]MDH5220094.1 exodeoxyribonuclease VII large subunit [Betaproteobacteria bacterium]MDH5351442.1 exodeoxyribonuclease VII large subunit [Betaproteobacteria bacterium]
MNKEILPQGVPVLSVSALLRSVRDTLEKRFPLAWVGGEISNFRPASSGHWYFTLKDESAQVDCVMFRSRTAALDWQPADGMRVEARALPTLYEPRGRFQLNVEHMRRAGLGPLYERFLRLKAKLEAEGVFDPSAKRDVPEHPRTIGVVTSRQAAALRDVLTTLHRRNPAIPVIVYPVPVQGEGAAARIAEMLAIASARRECDVLLLVRGGGSIEDLWSFNEEAVARAIRASAIPVVVGVGHETDVTIADFAADRRAPTPTAAAEMVSPSRAELLARVAELAERATREALRRIETAMQTVDALARRLVHPRERLRTSRQLLAQLAARLSFASVHRVESLAAQLGQLKAALASLNPNAVLERGYSLTRNARGEVVADASRVKEGERVTTTLARGWIESEVTQKGR